MKASVAGGHTAEGPELGVGLVVTGFADPKKLIHKGGLQPGDKLILTKALGTGLLLAADMRMQSQARWIDGAIKSMLVDNGAAAVAFRRAGATAMTDITGFGLAGHLGEMLQASHCGAALDLDALPLLAGAKDCMQSKIHSTLDPDNRQYVAEHWALRTPPKADLSILYDPQTSGGLLAGVPAKKADATVKTLHDAGYPSAQIIGEVTDKDGQLEIH